MARNEVTDVVAALDSLPAIDPSLIEDTAQRFLDDAAVFVERIEAADDAVSESTLTAIEKYLACHLVTVKYPRVTSATRGDVSEKLQRDASVTEYLKIAAAMDPTGIIGDAFLPDDSQPVFSARVGAGYAEC